MVVHWNNRIQKFDSNGSFINYWGGKGSANGRFAHPMGITADSNGNIYVAESTISNIFIDFTITTIYGIIIMIIQFYIKS